MGRNQVEQGEGGKLTTSSAGYNPTASVTTWDPPHRFAYRTPDGEDGRFIAYEFLIEGRSGASTVLRMVTSGFLPGDDWESEADAMTKGDQLFFSTLVTYLGHFAGRTGTPVTAFGPPVDDWPRAWAALHRELGLGGPPREGDRVRPSTDPALEGVAYFANEDTMGVRGERGLYRFLRGFNGPMVAAHVIFGEVDRAAAECACSARGDVVYSCRPMTTASHSSPLRRR
jgi:hypothetical protein